MASAAGESRKARTPVVSKPLPRTKKEVKRTKEQRATHCQSKSKAHLNLHCTRFLLVRLVTSSQSWCNTANAVSQMSQTCKQSALCVCMRERGRVCDVTKHSTQPHCREPGWRRLAQTLGFASWSSLGTVKSLASAKSSCCWPCSL